MLTKEEEHKIKKEIIDNYPGILFDATNIATKYEIESSYFETIWSKGVALIYQIDKAGYKLVKK